MADYDLKSITSDTDGPSADTELLFGSPDQSSGTPKPYSFAGIKTWIKSWIAKDDVGLSLVANRHSGYVVGRWYRSPDAVPVFGATISANTIMLYPFILPQSITVSDLAARVGTAVATKNIQLAIYANNPSTCRPTGNALSSTASMSVGSAVDISASLGANVSLVAGTVYWLAANTDAVGLGMASIAQSAPFGGALIGSSTLADVWGGGSGGTIIGVSASQTFGTWPDLTAATFSIVSNLATVPNQAFKVASVP